MIDPSDAAQQRRASSEWASLEARLRAVTPRGLARAALVTVVAGAGVTVIGASWSVLVPFAIGGLIAYVLMPAVDALERVMPRPLAAVLLMAGVLAALVVATVVVLPPLASGFVKFAAALPTASQIDASVAGIGDRSFGLPAESREIVLPIVGAVAAAFQGLLSGMSGGLDGAVRAVAQALLQTATAILGLIVLPTWMLAAMTNKRRFRRAIDARLAPWLRADVWAIVALADRAVGAYLRGYLVAAAFVGVLAYLGATASPRLGGPVFPEPLAFGLFAGVIQVVPVVGPLIGLLPGLLLLAVDADRASAYVAIYLVALLVGTRVVGARLMQRRLGVHPLLLVPSVLVVGQVGLLWLLLSAPIVSFVADLVRYIHGRLSEPPIPAGVLPRTAAWTSSSSSAGRSTRPTRRRLAAVS